MHYYNFHFISEHIVVSRISEEPIITMADTNFKCNNIIYIYVHISLV